MTPNRIAAQSGAELAKRLLPEVEREVPIQPEVAWAFWMGFIGVFLAAVFGSFDNAGRYKRFVAKLKDIQIGYAREVH